MEEKITGTILKFDVKDANDKIFPKECKITYPDKIPITKSFCFNKPNNVVGNASIIKKDNELIIEGEICDHVLDREPYFTHMGFFANNVEIDNDNKVTKMDIRAVALLSKCDCAMPGCKIKRIKRGD